MRKFNINHSVHIQITEYGWIHLRREYSEEYITNCITPYKRILEGKDWYELQLWVVFDLFPVSFGSPNLLFETNILI